MTRGPFTPGEGTDASAFVSPDSDVAPGVRIGPGSLVGPGVSIASEVIIGANVVIERDTRIGTGCRIYHGAVVGTDPQDLKYEGEPAILEIGERTVVRECATVNRGAATDGGTRIGSDCLLMTGCHVAHDCVLGDHVVMAGLTALGGHVEIGDWAILGGLAGAHQFTRIGAHAFIGGATKLTKDVPPYLLADGNPCRTRGINVVGLRRRGFDREVIEDLRTAYRLLFKSPDMNIGQALSLMETQGELGPEVASLVSFIRESERGVHT